jgi:hypothetical protein
MTDNTSKLSPNDIKKEHEHEYQLHLDYLKPVDKNDACQG